MWLCMSAVLFNSQNTKYKINPKFGLFWVAQIQAQGNTYPRKYPIHKNVSNSLPDSILSMLELQYIYKYFVIALCLNSGHRGREKRRDPHFFLNVPPSFIPYSTSPNLLPIVNQSGSEFRLVFCS